jgi:hypothetical protein
MNYREWIVLVELLIPSAYIIAAIIGYPMWKLGLLNVDGKKSKNNSLLNIHRAHRRG